ncbi:MAG: NAD-dependent epimerase/dehydratase family protein [Alphaproteobacteria bacterium]|nr:NAD-dependent epimerase/dehydratase family protein [Alphaproteobacteria bacterium]
MADNQEIILVFGGSGFIGHHLLARLRQTESAARLVSVDLRHPQFPVAGVDYKTGDVRDLSGFDPGGKVRRIYNLAAIHATPGHAAHEYYETNVMGAVEVAAFARRHGIDDIVFTSSISVYGAGEARKDETSPPAPDSAYGWSKSLAERIHRAWADEDKSRRLTIVRPAVIFGPHEGGNFTRMARLLKKGFFVYPGRTDTIKACFYIDDLLDALDAARGTGEPRILFNGCYPDRYTIKQIVSAFRAGYFPDAREFTVPYPMVWLAARMLRIFAPFGLGIHPDRVGKLVRSTDIYPGWLEARGLAKRDALAAALERWSKASGGRFE